MDRGGVKETRLDDDVAHQVPFPISYIPRYGKRWPARRIIIFGPLHILLSLIVPDTSPYASRLDA